MNTACKRLIETCHWEATLALRWRHREAYGPPGFILFSSSLSQVHFVSFLNQE
jgi:hypothetical protein